jgi:hypothetical protein
MSLRRLLALIAPALCLGAAPPDDFDPMCRNGLFPSEPPFALAKVNDVNKRAVFHEDMDGCPWKGADCGSRAYAVPGDTVIVSKVHDGFACAFYPSKGGGTAGWVPSLQLSLLPTDTRPDPARWLGRWSSEGNPRLVFSRKTGALHVSGEAWWPGPPGTHDWPTTHEGGIDGSVAIVGNTGHYGEDENLCEVRFSLLGDYLMAGDNGNCGGANVRFSAVYTRAKP